MNAINETIDRPAKSVVPHVIKGEIVTGAEQDYGRFATPRLDLDALVWRRDLPAPAADVPTAEILDILEQLGSWLTRDPEGAVETAMLASLGTNPLEKGVLQRSYETLGHCFDRKSLMFQIEQELGGVDVLDGWREVTTPTGRRAQIRAFPPRLIHIVAGNAPGVSAMTVARGALPGLSSIV